LGGQPDHSALRAVWKTLAEKRPSAARSAARWWDRTVLAGRRGGASGCLAGCWPRVAASATEPPAATKAARTPAG